MMILNSSGLVVQVLDAIPAVSAGPWGNPSWPKGSVGETQVSPQLGDSVSNDSGAGRFSLGTRVVGTRGSILASLITGPSGMARTVGYLTDDPLSPTRRIEIGLDEMNRPKLAIYDYLGVLKASVVPTYAAPRVGDQILVVMSWDSAQAIDGTRLALLQVNQGAVPSGDWVTNPIAAWTPFQPTYAVLGFGVGGALEANGQLLSFQVSNDTVAGGTGSSGTFPSTRVFDRFLSDNVSASTT